MSDKKKILIIADFGSIHLYNYAKNVLSNIKGSIYGFNIAGPIEAIRPNFKQFYDEIGIKLYGGIKLKEGKLKYMITVYKELSKLGSFDICHLHFASHYICPSVYLLRKKYGKIILSFWGSDLYRANAIVRSLYHPLIEKSSAVSFITEDMFEYFKKYFNKESIISKCTLLDFGNLFFQDIDDIGSSFNMNRFYDQLQLNCKKITITVGYCWRSQMRQYEAIKRILPVVDKNYMQIAIPAYGIPENEKKKIQELLDPSGISYVIYDYFMGADEVPALRKLTDIFIHPQTSDALSNAMTEHIYAGSVVINGEWLNYKILDDNKVFYIKFKSIEDLPLVLSKTLKNIDNYQLKAQKNKDIVESFTSWKYWAPKWLELYKQ